MGRLRQLCYAANAERRKRENEEEERRPGTRPLLVGGLGPYLQDCYNGKRLWEENFYLNTARGRSRPFLTPWPFLQIHHQYQPHSLPCCLTGRFGYVAPNVTFVPRLNNPPLCTLNQPHYVPPPAPLQNQEQDAENSSSESSDSEEGDSLEGNHGSP